MKHFKKYEDFFTKWFNKPKITETRITLFDAIKEDDVNLLKYLIYKKKDVNLQDHEGNTPLIKAIYLKNNLMVKILIEAGSNTDIQNIYGETALIISSFFRNIDVIKMLIDAGADWNIKSNSHNDFIDYLNLWGYTQKIINLYPEKYKKYLMKKDIVKYNI